MGVRFRKSINLGGGVRLNVNKRSLGLSVGTKGLRHSVNTSGRRTTTVSIPGTGLSHVTTKGGGKRSTTRGTPVSIPEPGDFRSHKDARQAP
jgi:hypothetical protein